MSVILGETPLSASDIVRVARFGETITIAPSTLAMLEQRRAMIEEFVAQERPVYGVSTGFGSLATTFISKEKRQGLQQSLIRSHAAGVGPEVEKEVVRAMMASRLTTLCSGVSGIRPDTALAYAALLNAQITPVVHEFGSLGCSGDLAPLAHVALALMGEGTVRDADGDLVPALDALTKAALAPVILAEKEGLALINGTDGMLGMLVLALGDARELMRTADVTASLSIEALLGTDQVFSEDLQALRPHPGQQKSARNLRALLANSPIVASHSGDITQVQDAYSLRCAPQVHGAARDTLDYAAKVGNIELASYIDNPSVLPDGHLSSNGNFHGAPIAYVLDVCAIVLADVASMSERRTDRMLDPHRNYGLNAFLAHDPGVDSGLMIAQYTQASLVSDMKRLAVPASVDSIPSSAMQEDHVSMGWHAARKLRKAVEDLNYVLAIELVTATRAIALRGIPGPAPVGEALVKQVAALGIGPGPDRYVSPQLEAAADFVRQGLVTTTAEEIIGELA